MRFCLGIAGSWILAAQCFAAALEDYPSRASSVVRADRRTGRLVRAVVVRPAQRRQAAAAASPIPEVVRKAAVQKGLDPLLVHSVIQAESNYNPFAVSPKGAQGLMQLMPATARRYGVTNGFSIAENVQAGVSYLRDLLDAFGDRDLALAAYNAGEAAVIRHGGIPPYDETRRYVRAVGSRYAGPGRRAPAVAPAELEGAAAQTPLFRPVEQYIDPQGNLHIFTTR
ncbi:MAG: lytic transglycosylase domain-containing protein [Bryobacterales bacterium]|nr:lytic transglycosylase domain-containing protein [Bryobacterales bacterium]